MNPSPLRPAPARSTVAAILSGLVALGLPIAAAEPEAASPPAATAAAPASAAEDTAQPAEPAEDADAAAPEKEAAAEESPAGETPVEAAPGEFRNWFNVSVGGLIVDGDKAAAQQRLGVPASAFGGVEEFHFEKDVGKKGLFRIDGRGIFDNEDYRIRLDYTDSDKGFIRGGFHQYREYSDGSGGWFPPSNTWFDLYDDRLELLRGGAWFEAGLRKANLPEITVRYDHEYRDGMKDSTIWGDTSLTGVGPRAIVPSFWQIDENTDRVRLDVRHTLGNTLFGGAFTYETSDLDNSLNLRRRPGEASDRYVTQTETVERDVYSARAFVDTVLNDKVRMTTAYLFTTLDTDLGGSRIVGADYDAVYDPIYARRDVGFLNLTGGTQLDQHQWNASVLWTPIPNVSIIPALRVENQNLDGATTWLDTGAESIAREAENDRDMLDLSQQLEVRYTGITNVVLYARGDWVQGDGNLLEAQLLSQTSTTELYRDSDFDRFSQKYTAGAHWYPARRVNLHAQYYRKMRDESYDLDTGSYVNLSPLYPGFISGHDFTTDDVNFRITWRPIDKLTLVTRYDYQLNNIEMESRQLGSQDSGENTAHILGETITWTPFQRLYIQPGINYVWSETQSDATSGGAPVEAAENDYMNIACTVGFAMDDRTDLQAQYSYYLADNFNAGFALASQPYGAGMEEHGILASVIRRITPKLRVTLRYGFFTSSSEMSGGNNDYDAHYLYSSAQYLF